MGELVGLIVLAFFFWGFWIFSGWVVRNKASKYYVIKRGILFLAPVWVIVGIQVVEYVLFQQACKEAVVYFPEKKSEAPEILITDDSSYENQGRYFDGMFKYIVSPHYSNNRPVDLTRNKEQFNDYIVYPYKSKPMEGNDKQQILEEIRYLLVRSPALELETWYSYSSDIYI